VLGRLLLIASVGLLALLAYRLWDRDDWIRALVPAGTAGPSAAARSTTAYALDETRWTRFALVTREPYLRIISNGELPLAVAEAEGDDGEWHYSIAYRLLAGDGTGLGEGVFHHRTKMGWLIDPGSGARFASASHLPPDLQPADGRVTVLNLTDRETPDFVELRVGGASAPLRRVVARVYQQQRFDDREVERAWQRLTWDRRDQYAMASVYPAELLSERERRHLLGRRWVRLAPTGLLGEDYRAERLYVLEGHEGQPLEDPVVPAGLPFGPGLRAVIPVPPGGGRLHLVLAPLREDPARAHRVGMLRWYGRPATRLRRWTLGMGGMPSVWEERLEEGLIELEMPEEGAVRAWLLEDGARREVTPEPTYLRVFEVPDGEPLVFPVAHSGAEPTPLRLDLRGLSPAPETVRYTLRDAQGRVSAEGVLGLDGRPSAYDALVGDPELRLSEPARFYFNLPPGVAGLGLQGAGVLAAAFTRLARQTAQQEIPAPPEGTGSVPVWFPIRPRGQEDLQRKGRAPLLNVQRRPPELDRDILLGRYRWERFLPEGPWLGNYLLVPFDPQAPERTESLDARFTPVDGERLLHFPDPFGSGQVRATLLYQREVEGPLEVRVSLDGRLHHRARVRSPSGEIELPPFDSGEHRVQVDGAARFLLNRASGGGWLKQLATRIGPEGLGFRYVKASAAAELLSLRFFADPGQEGPQALRVSLEGVPRRGPGPYRDWTVLERRFLVWPGDGQAVASVRTGAASAKEGRLLFLPMGEDLPGGAYRLRVWLEGGLGGHLILSRTTPGLHHRREFRVES
jgi:hypothetical protein